MLLVKLSLTPLSVLNCRYETDKIAHSVLIGKSAVILIPFASELAFLSRPLGAMLLHPQSSFCPAQSKPSDKWPGNQAEKSSKVKPRDWAVKDKQMADDVKPGQGPKPGFHWTVTGS